MKNILKYGMMAFVAAVGLGACSDWTEPESVKVVYDGVSDSDPDTYNKYLENLRAYRNNGHKKVYAWFANTGSFNSQADHVSAVPDSIDVLVLHNPQHVSGEALDDLNKKRSQTGMLMACTVDFDAIKASWNLKKELEQAGGAVVPEWNKFLNDSLSVALKHASDAQMDRVIAAFIGQDVSHLPQPEKEQYLADQETFFKGIRNWVGSGSGRGYDYMGVPTNITDDEILSNAGILFLYETLTATSTPDYNYIVTRACAKGIDEKRVAVIAPLPGFDAANNPVGKWGDQYTSWAVARWARSTEIGAVGFTNLYNDYYNPTFIYPVCRQAIQLLNPAVK